MHDRDLAELYGVEVGQLNRQVKRNIERFPDDFMFQLTHEDCSRCQIDILNSGRGSNINYLPYVFTENGIAMLSSGASLNHLGKKCFAFSSLDMSNIPDILAKF